MNHRRTRRVVLYGRPARVSGRRAGQGRVAARGDLLRQARHRGRFARLGVRLGARVRAARHRELRQSDSDGRGRHACQRLARRHRRCGAGVLRVPQSRAARLEVDRRGRLGRREFRAVDENARAAVRRPDQGEAVLARVRRHRPGRHQGRVRAVAQSASGSGRENRDAGDRQCPAALQGQPEDRAQAHRGRAGAAGQAWPTA